MLATSLIILGHPVPIPGEDKPADSEYNMEKIIFMARFMRGYIIFSRIVICLFDTIENKLLIRILRGIEIFYYMGVVLYQ